MIYYRIESACSWLEEKKIIVEMIYYRIERRCAIRIGLNSAESMR